MYPHLELVVNSNEDEDEVFPLPKHHALRGIASMGEGNLYARHYGSTSVAKVSPVTTEVDIHYYHDPPPPPHHHPPRISLMTPGRIPRRQKDDIEMDM
jgi:hypothetical protein